MDTENDNALAVRPVSELAPAPEPAPADPYLGASTLTLTDKEKQALTEPLRDDEIKEFPPTAGQMAGLLYADHVAIRRRLNAAFGPGSWALIPAEPPIREKNYVCQRWRLYVRGVFVAEGFGEQDFRMGSNELTFPTALEGAKSNALTRCAKDLSIGIELWDRSFAAKWKLRRDASRRAIEPAMAPSTPETRSPVSEPPSAKEPAREPAVNDDLYDVTGTVASVTVGWTGKRTITLDDGSKKQVPSTLWRVLLVDGKELSTFSTTIYDGCMRLLASSQPGTFTIREKTGKKGEVYLNIESMKGAFST